MAYRNFAETSLDLPAGMAAAVNAAVEAASFTDLEYRVIDIARQDPLSSVEAPGRIAAKLAWLMGSYQRLPLADPRLEALRRFVVVGTHLGDRLPDEEVAHFVGAGFSLAHVRLLRSTPSYR